MKIKINKQKAGKTFVLIGAIVGILFLFGSIQKANENEIIGYTYDSGVTVWEMARRACPANVDIRDVAREIEKLNEIENHTVCEGEMYKVPIYADLSKANETDYLDMSKVIGYSVSDDGVLVHTSDGNGYYIEK